MFDWEQGVALHGMQGSWASSLIKGEVSWFSQVAAGNWGWQDNTDASGGEAGDQVSLSSWNNNIGIPIHFQKESGIVTF